MSTTLLVLAAMTVPTAAPTEDAALATFFKAFLDAEARRRPLDATRLGDHRYDHLLDDLSPEARAERVKAIKAALAELPKAVDASKLSPAGRIDFEILRHHLTREIWLDEQTDSFTTDPRVYNEYISDAVYLLLTQSTLPRDVNVRNATARLAFVPQVVAAAKVSLKNPPRAMTETAIRQNRGAIAFFESGLGELAGDSPGRAALEKAAKAVVPVLKEYQQFLETELLPRATGDFRLGKDKFSKKLELELDAGLTAEQVLADAEAEAERVERELAVIARQMWGKRFAGTPIPPEDVAGRRELVGKVIAAVSKDHGTPEALIRDTQATVDRIKAFITERKVLKLPEPDRCQVIEMPEFQRGNSVAFLNSAPPLDPSAVSVYAVSPPPRDWDARRVQSYLEEYNRHMLQILTIHEAYPGHYVQLEYANRNPSLIRKVLGSGVYIEGWAVYTEQMMLDHGYGDGDLGLRLNQLKFYLRAVLNAILDHKMHCSGMTDAEAMELLVGRGFQSEGEAVGKIVRAKQSSCQLSTYFVGRMAFYRLRQQVQRTQGDKFELAAFHERVLNLGSVPVKYLPQLVGNE